METKRALSPAREIAYIAVETALLIGAQYAFSFAMGIEVVTVLLAAFSYVFGARRGAVAALAFSLLRCLIYGFDPTTVITYVLYYPLLAAVFGLAAFIKDESFCSPDFKLYAAACVPLSALAAGCAACASLDIIALGEIWKTTVNVLLWVIFGVCVLLLVLFNALFFLTRAGKAKGGKVLKITLLCAVACIMTVCFTLLNDGIFTLFYGLGREEALAYFYSSFTAIAPQTVCAAASMLALFLPLTEALKRVKRL